MHNDEGWAEGGGEGGEGGDDGLSREKQDLERMLGQIWENAQSNRVEKAQLCVVLKVGEG